MDLTSQLRASILAQGLPPPSNAFLTGLVSSRTPPPPIASLLATAKARLLACDLSNNTSVLDGSLPAFPADIDNVRAEDTRLQRDIHVQVVDIENLSLSRWEQIEELEAIERGERTRGREIIRVTAEEDVDGDEEATAPSRGGRNATSAAATVTPAAGRNATHRLVLQDCKGKRVFAVELKRIDQIGVSKTTMGEKMVLKAGTVIARGTVLLNPESCVLLGGKIDLWHEAWSKGRLERLKQAVGADRPQR